MDAFARGLIVADKLIKQTNFRKMRKERYASFDSGEGARFEKGELRLEELAKLAGQYGEPKKTSGKQELYENIINQIL